MLGTLHTLGPLLILSLFLKNLNLFILIGGYTQPFEVNMIL